MNPTPPVNRDGFEYYNHEFYAVSNNRPYRRYTIAELRAHLSSSSSKVSIKDQPAHWYRAQLLHYGLPPTDSKGTAMMRLLDALNRDALEIPANLKKLERDLKKKWDSNQKKAKETSEKPIARTTAKRKADTAFDDIDGAVVSGNLAAIIATTKGAGPTVNINVNMGGMGSQHSQSAAKKEAAKKEAPRMVASKDTAKREALNKAAPKTYPPKSTFRKETVKKELGKKELKMEPIPKEQPRLNCPGMNLSPPRLSLGLLNGSYKIDSQDVNTRNSGMILCLDKTSIWGEFQIGEVEGILFMRQRPFQVTSSGDGGCSFEWRGVDQETGESLADPDCTGKVRFLGNGEIEGTFCNIPGARSSIDCDFWGHRTSAKDETRAPRDAWSMRDEWNNRFFH